jgi:hypothetical protein
MSNNIHERYRGHEAKIKRSGDGKMRPWCELSASLVQVNLLVAKAQGRASFAECFHLHLEDFDVKASRSTYVDAGHHKMVKVIDKRHFTL